MTRKKRVLYYGIYTLLFSILAGMVVYFYYSQGKSLIESNGDGFRQHFRSVVYYSEYLKGIFRNLFINGKLVIPQWDFVIGEGSDILTALHYYCIGDIFTFFSLIFVIISVLVHEAKRADEEGKKLIDYRPLVIIAFLSAGLASLLQVVDFWKRVN